MSSSEPIGGFFELELPARYDPPHPAGLQVNSGRAALQCLLEAIRPKRVHLPRYTCDAVLEPIERLAIPHRLYDLTPKLEIADEIEPGEGEILIYNNYFGVKDGYCRALAARFGDRLVLDCAQALYAEASGGTSAFYSPRKFVGVPDGGILVTPLPVGQPALPEDRSSDRMSHLLRRIEDGPQAAYAEFRESEARLDGAPPRPMSPLARRVLGAIDHGEVRRRRIENFALLHDALGAANPLVEAIEPSACPMAYPFLAPTPEVRHRLIAANIFVATYWPNVLAWSAPGSVEHALASRMLPLPIDQRYEKRHMMRIVEVLA